MSEYSESAKAINSILRDHKLAEGMQVSSGSTCQCGYWTGEERPGVSRPPGIRDALDWHRATLVDALLSTQLATIATAVGELQRMTPAFSQSSGLGYTDDRQGELLVRAEVLQAIDNLK